MPLERQIIDLPIVGGIDEGSVPAGTVRMSSMTNMRYVKTGGVRTRTGTDTLRNGTANILNRTLTGNGNTFYPNATDLVFSHNGTAVTIDVQGCVVGTSPLGSGNNIAPGVDLGRFPSCVAETGVVVGGIPTASGNTVLFGIASGHANALPTSMIVTAAGYSRRRLPTESSGTNYSDLVVVNQATGATIVRRAVSGVAGADTFICRVFPNYCIFLWNDGSTLYADRYSLLTNAWIGTQTISSSYVGGLSASTNRDASSLGICFSIGKTGANYTSMKVGYIGISAATSTLYSKTFTGCTSTCCDVDTANGYLYVFTDDAISGGRTNIQSWVIDSAGSDIRALATAASGYPVYGGLSCAVDASSPVQALVLANGSQTGGTVSSVMAIGFTVAGGLDTATRQACAWAHPLSGPLKWGDSWYSAIGISTDFLTTGAFDTVGRNFVVKWEGANGAANVDYPSPTPVCSFGSSSFVLQTNRMSTYLPQPFVPAAGFSNSASTGYGVAFVGTVTDAKRSSTANTFVAVSLGTSLMRFAEPRTWDKFGELAVVSGGIPAVFDGSQLVELAPLIQVPAAIANVAAAVSGGGGALAANTTYSVMAMYKLRYANGATSNGAPSSAFTVTTNATSNSIVANIPCLPLTLQGPVTSKRSLYPELEIYLSNGGATSTSYYYAPEGTVSTFADWSKTATNVFTMTTSSTINTWNGTTATIYTDGASASELENTQPPSGKIVAVHKGRIHVAGTDSDSIYYSKQAVDGTIPGFNAGLAIEPFTGGRVTALATTQDSLIIFKASSIWFVAGQYPDDTGSGGNLSDPVQIATDIGCVTHRSIAYDPKGIYFQSERGIEFLSGGAITWIGQPVQDAMAGKIVTSATTTHDTSEIRFTLATRIGNRWDPFDTTAQDVLVYNYDKQAWSKFQYYDKTASAGYAAGIQGVSTSNGYAFATYRANSAPVYVENSNSYMDCRYFANGSDNGYSPIASFETANFRTASMQGQNRVWRVKVLGKPLKVGTVAVNTSVTSDYGYGFNGAVTLTYSNNGATTVPQFRELCPTTQRVASIRVIANVANLNDAPNIGKAWECQGITLELGVYPTGYRGNFAGAAQRN